MWSNLDPNVVASFFGMMLGSGGFLRYLLNRYDKRAAIEAKKCKEKEEHHEFILKNLLDLTCALTQFRIVRQVEKFSRIGGITMADRAMIQEMYAPYKALGRNHLAKDAMELLEQIPTIPYYTNEEVDRKERI